MDYWVNNIYSRWPLKQIGGALWEERDPSRYLKIAFKLETLFQALCFCEGFASSYCAYVDVLCVCMSQKHYLAAKARAQIYLLALLIYFQYVTLYMCYLAVVYWVATTFDTRWMCRDATTRSQVADISCSLLCIHLGLSSSGMSDMYVFRYAIATLKTSFHFLPFFLLFPLTHQLSLSYM